MSIETKGFASKRAAARVGLSVLASVAATSVITPAAQAQYREAYNAAVANSTSSNKNATTISFADYVVAVCEELVALGRDAQTAEEQDLNNRCNGAVGQALVAGDVSGSLGALRGIAPDEMPAIDPDVNDVLGSHSSSISARMSALAGGGGAAMLANRGPQRVILASNRDEDVGYSGSSSVSLTPPLAGFLTVGYGGGGQDATSLETGFDVDSYSITGGADYRISDSLTLGAALGYSSSEVDFDQAAGGAGGDLDSDAIIVSGYGIYYPTPNFYISGLLSYADVSSDSVRDISYSDICSTAEGEADLQAATGLDCTENAAVERSLTGEIDSQIFEATGTAAYDVVQGAFMFGPTLGLSYQNSDVDGYVENDPLGGLDLEIGETEYESLQASLGGRASYAMSQTWGVLVPTIRGRYIYEALDDSRTINVRYVNDQFGGTGNVPNGFLLTTNAPDRSRFEIGGGVSAAFPNNWSAFVDASSILGYENVTNYAVFLGARRHF